MEDIRCVLQNQPKTTQNNNNINVTFNFNVTINGVLYIINPQQGTAKIVSVDPALAGDIAIPRSINGCNVIGVEDNAFSGCNSLNSITLPDTVTEISDNAFDSGSQIEIRGEQGSAVEDFANDNNMGFQQSTEESDDVTVDESELVPVTPTDTETPTDI